MSKRVICGLLVVLAALGTAGLAGRAWAADDDAVLLQYKFTAGQTRTYEISGHGVIPMTINAGAEAGGMDIGLDLNLDLNLSYEQECQTVDDKGVGTLQTKFPLLTVKMSMQAGPQAIDTLVNWEKDALAVTLNGQPMPLDEAAQKMQTMLRTPLLLTISPTGTTKLEARSAETLGAIASLPMMGISSGVNNLTTGFSDKPVKPGDTWQISIKPEEVGGGLEGTSDYKFVSYEEVDGVRCARIEGQARFRTVQALTNVATGMPGQMNVNSMDVATSFINWFDPATGEMVLSRQNLAQNMSLTVAVGGGGGVQMTSFPATVENSQMTLEIRKPKAK